MKIIDAHMHYFATEGFDQLAKAVGDVNSVAGYEKVCQENGVVFSVAMGNSYEAGSRFGGEMPRLINLAGRFRIQPYNQPKNIGYCLGVNSEKLTEANAEQTAQEFEYYLQHDPHCLGIKFYMGYNLVYLNDKRHQPLFELAAQYDVPVAMHSGETAGGHGQLKYAHPLTVDEAASEHPDVKFVICHLGNPWIQDTVAVACKNENVYIDLSGLLEGYVTPAQEAQQAEYFNFIRLWLKYLNNWDKVLYGSDWPLVKIKDNIRVLGHLVPEEHHEQFFFRNALNVYDRIQKLLPPEMLAEQA